MINIVIPMAGAGSRFAKAGYKKPKPFIDVLGKPMICHVLDNLNMPNAKFILLARAEHYNNEQETVNWIKEHYNVEFVLIDKLTEGAACTVLHAHRLINNDTPMLIANSDQIVDMNIADYINDSENRKLDGSVLCFEDNDKKWSYAKLDESGFITMIREKEVISEHATVGIYYFHKGRDFVENAIDMIVRNDRVNNEFYVAPVYNYAIAQGEKFGIYTIDKFFTDMDNFGYDFDFLALCQTTENNKDLPYYCATYEPSYIYGQPIDCRNFNILPNTCYVNGGCMVFKTKTLQCVKFNNLLFWNQMEDVEITQEFINKSIVPRVNIISHIIAVDDNSEKMALNYKFDVIKENRIIFNPQRQKDARKHLYGIGKLPIRIKFYLKNKFPFIGFQIRIHMIK